MQHSKSDPFRFYSGYVPSGEVFRMMADEVVALSREEPGDAPARHNLCLIGLLAYFEAFAKDQLSTVLSLAPAAIERLKAAGHPTDVTARDALNLRDDIDHQIGFLVVQRLDLGTSKKINAAFTTAIKVTPFGKDEMGRYNRMLRDRNLIVHHGGVYTTAYLEQARDEIEPGRRIANAYSIGLTCADIGDAAKFLKRVVRSVVNASAKKLHILATEDGSIADPARRKAIEYMDVWGEESALIDAKLEKQIAEFEQTSEDAPTKETQKRRGRGAPDSEKKTEK
jgi:hypothetical protein